MNNVILKSMLTFCLLAVLSTTGFSQLNLPKKSPKASISYTIGLTDITINYSSPAVNGRTIWGDLEPWNEIWRAGANEATTIEFSTPVILEGKPLAKGKYAFFVIPKEEGEIWTIIFNKVADQWGAYQYNKEEDALRADVKVKMGRESEERLNYRIVDTAKDGGYIRLAWDKMQMHIQFSVKVISQGVANVEAALKTAEEKDQWVIYGQGAEFLLNNNAKLDLAKEWAVKSTDLFKHSWNYWIRAQAFAANEDYLGAVETAKKCEAIASVNEKDRFYESAKKEINAAIAEWSAKQ